VSFIGKLRKRASFAATLWQLRASLQHFCPMTELTSLITLFVRAGKQIGDFALSSKHCLIINTAPCWSPKSHDTMDYPSHVRATR
jgi:hypothetical protein